MPKSKRERKSALTQVQKKTRTVKDQLVSRIRAAVETQPNLFVFQVRHMKNTALKALREAWPGSRFFLGKNKVMQLALGRHQADELKPGLAQLAQHITGARGLLATDKSEREVVQALGQVGEWNYARAGFVCTGNYRLAAGTLPADRCPHPMEPMLRKLGLPTKLVQGRVELLSDVNVCAKGDVLTPEQCKILQLFGVKLAQFKVDVLYSYANGRVKELPAVAQIEAEEAGEGEEQKEGGEDDEEWIELRTAGGEFEPFLGGDADDGDDMKVDDAEDDEDME